MGPVYGAAATALPRDGNRSPFQNGGAFITRSYPNQPHIAAPYPNFCFAPSNKIYQTPFYSYHFTMHSNVSYYYYYYYSYNAHSFRMKPPSR